MKRAFIILIIFMLSLSIFACAAEENVPQGERGMFRDEPPEGFENMQPPEGFENMPRGGKRERIPSSEAPVLNDDAPSKDFFSIVKEYQTPIISVILLALAFPFVILYKRKNY